VKFYVLLDDLVWQILFDALSKFLLENASESAYMNLVRYHHQGFHFRKLKFIGVTDKEDKHDISEISDQI